MPILLQQFLPILLNPTTCQPSNKGFSLHLSSFRVGRGDGYVYRSKYYAFGQGRRGAQCRLCLSGGKGAFERLIDSLFPQTPNYSETFFHRLIVSADNGIELKILDAHKWH